MTNATDMRAAAEAALGQDWTGLHAGVISCDEHAIAHIVASQPRAVLALLDELDELRAEIQGFQTLLSWTAKRDD